MHYRSADAIRRLRTATDVWRDLLSSLAAVHRRRDLMVMDAQAGCLRLAVKIPQQVADANTAARQYSIVPTVRTLY